MDKLATIIGTLVALLALSFSTYFYIDSRYALASDQTQHEQEFEVYRLEQTMVKALDNYYDLKGLQRKYPQDATLSEKVDRAEKQFELLESKVKTLKMKEKDNDK